MISLEARWPAGHYFSPAAPENISLRGRRPAAADPAGDSICFLR